MTLPEQRQLVQFGVKGTRNLYVKSQIRTEIGYVCLAYDRDYSKLVCCVTLPFGHPRIDVVNGNGSVYKTFVWSQLLEDPRSLVIREDGVMVVLDQKRKCLIFVSTSGEFLGLYKGTANEPLRDPGYLCLDRNLNIYVTDSESHAIDIVRLDRTRMCRIQSDVELGMPREVDLLDGGLPKLAFHDVSYGNGYISVYDLSVPVAVTRLSSASRQPSTSYMENEALPVYSPLPQETPSAPLMNLDTSGENPPSYESIFGTAI
ncbi:hypothetical protein FSP39_012577 [Pinctada imbricata]|uniref:Uncharacterized protein n=1 Tax=Pinctada imbricata TaxID=66713 RepID=A0AA88XQT0_PINIB|nr:hypothetical protein FSP39_012577 [Pinctada imbricata]